MPLSANVSFVAGSSSNHLIGTSALASDAGSGSGPASGSVLVSVSVLDQDPQENQSEIDAARIGFGARSAARFLAAC